MDQSVARTAPRYGMLSLVIVALIGGALGFKIIRNKADIDSTANFTISYPPATDGWTVLPHGPQALFLYEQKSTGLYLRGSVNQMVSEVNPTPDLDRDNLAQLMVDNTHDNMKGWSAEVEDIVQANGTSFRIVRRSEKAHVVVTAFAVKGNTTLLVSLAGSGKSSVAVDKGMDDFRHFLSSVALTKADSSKW